MTMPLGGGACGHDAKSILAVDRSARVETRAGQLVRHTDFFRKEEASE